jgi:GNAT superfamily N-acetyltransferase
MSVSHVFVNTTPSDLPFIFDLFDQSILYQEKHCYPVWLNYDKGAIECDMLNKNQYKVLVDDVIGIVFSVAYSDKIIWRERDKIDAVYLHRIVVNPIFKGQKLFGAVMKWAIRHTQQKGLQYLRMDTWAVNTNIINYYQSFGFSIIENYTTPNSAALPEHNRNLALTLLEYKI